MAKNEKGIYLSPEEREFAYLALVWFEFELIYRRVVGIGGEETEALSNKISKLKEKIEKE